MQTSPAIRISRDRFHLAWDPAIAAIETVESGAVVEFDLLDASGGQLTATSTLEDLARLDFDRVDQVNGPIAVAGAEPGDTLQVDLLEFEPADWGWTASIPGFGLLADDFADPALRISRVPGIGERAEFLPGVRVPIVPFCGEIGVAPPTGPRSTIPPDLHGGNMDTRHLTAGSTLYLPVFHAGGRLSMGDGHAAQGDGELTGNALERLKKAERALKAEGPEGEDRWENVRELLTSAAEASFNRISIDGDTSTNDTVVLLASGASGAAPEPGEFAHALDQVCHDLARQLLAAPSSVLGDCESGQRVRVGQVRTPASWESSSRHPDRVLDLARVRRRRVLSRDSASERASVEQSSHAHSVGRWPRTTERGPVGAR